MPRRGLALKADGTPANMIQRNFTDPDSHLMQSGGTYLQGYNCQLAVDRDHQVSVAVGVSNQPPDVEHLEPMLERIAASTGELPDVMTMDAGYWSEDNVNFWADQGIDAVKRHQLEVTLYDAKFWSSFRCRLTSRSVMARRILLCNSHPLCQES